MVTQNDFNELNLNLEKLRTGIAVLDNKRADYALMGLINNSLNTVKKLEINFNENPIKADSPQSMTFEGSTPDQSVMDGSAQKMPDRIVLHKMGFWESRDLVSGPRLYSGSFVQEHFEFEVDTFELTLERATNTVSCIRYANDLLLRKSQIKINMAAIKASVFKLWATIMQASDPQAVHQALVKFEDFVDQVMAKIDAVEDSTVEGIKIFNIS